MSKLADGFDTLEEVDRLKRGARRGGPPSEELLHKLTALCVPPPPWEPQRTGRKVIVGYQRFAELVAPLEVVSHLPNPSPGDSGPTQLASLPASTLLESLSRGGTDVDLALTPMKRTLPHGRVERFLLVRPASAPLQPEEVLSEAVGIPAGWRLALDPDPILRALTQ